MKPDPTKRCDVSTSSGSWVDSPQRQTSGAFLAGPGDLVGIIVGIFTLQDQRGGFVPQAVRGRGKSSRSLYYSSSPSMGDLHPFALRVPLDSSGDTVHRT